MSLNSSPSIRRGTSGSEASDLRPDYSYDIDLRRVDADERDIVSSLNRDQDAIKRRVQAAKVAGAYQKRALIDQPTIRGKTPRGAATIEGVTLPSMGEAFGPVGATKYADKPKAFTGEVFY